MLTSLDKECNPSFKDLYTLAENPERDPQEPEKILPKELYLIHDNLDCLNTVCEGIVRYFETKLQWLFENFPQQRSCSLAGLSSDHFSENTLKKNSFEFAHNIHGFLKVFFEQVPTLVDLIESDEFFAFQKFEEGKDLH
jgi:hypothetical protein